MTYEQRRKELLESILAKLKESGYESDLIEPENEYHSWSHFRRESDGAMVMFSTCDFRPSRYYKVSGDEAFVTVEVVGSRRQKFSPTGEFQPGKFVVTKDIDPAKVAAKVIREFEYEAKRMSDAKKRDAEADAIDAKADEINQRVGRNVAYRKSLGRGLFRPGRWHVLRVDLRNMNDGEVESFVDDMHAAGLLKWLKDWDK